MFILLGRIGLLLINFAEFSSFRHVPAAISNGSIWQAAKS